MKNTPETRKRLIAGIWAEARHLPMSSDEQAIVVHDVCYEITRKKSLRKCNATELNNIRDAFRHFARKDPATNKQIAGIRNYADSNGWNSARLVGWLHKQTGKAKLYDLTKSEATKVIFGFKRLTQEGKAS